MYVAAQKTFFSFPLQFNSNGERNTYKNILTNDPFSNLLCNYAKNGIRVVHSGNWEGGFFFGVVMLALLHVVAFSVG